MKRSEQRDLYQILRGKLNQISANKLKKSNGVIEGSDKGMIVKISKDRVSYEDEYNFINLPFESKDDLIQYLKAVNATYGNLEGAVKSL